MSVKITDNTKAVMGSIEQKASIFLRIVADNVLSISKPGTPKKTGRLRMDVLKQVLGLNGKIVWGKGYAARMESIRHKKYTTPGTGPHFAENAIKDVVKLTSKIARQAGLIQ